MATMIPYGNVRGMVVVSLTLSPASVAANTTAEQTFTLSGVQPGDVVYVNKPTAQAGLGIVGSRASAANQIGITFSNNTASPIVPTATQTYLVTVLRPDTAMVGSAQF
jgi:hypothetical protein